MNTDSFNAEAQRPRGTNDDHVSENWKNIAVWPDYQISDFGNVRRGGKPVVTFLVDGYPAFNVSMWGQRKSLRVHREVAIAFLGFQRGMLVRHLDGNPRNCASSNLAWGTHEENERDKRYHGTDLSGQHHHRHKLRSADVLAIRNSNAKRRDLANIYGVEYRTIYAIQKGETWRHL